MNSKASNPGSLPGETPPVDKEAVSFIREQWVRDQMQLRQEDYTEVFGGIDAVQARAKSSSTRLGC